MARRKVEAVLQVKLYLSRLRTSHLIFKTFFLFILQQEIETNDQWDELLKKPGLIGIYSYA